MRDAVRAALAVLRADARVESSYPASAVFALAAGLFGLFILYYLSRTVGTVPALARHGGDYFRFALLGTALATVARGGLTGVARRVREAQLNGTLSFLLGTPAPAPAVLAGMSLFPVCASVVRAAIYVALAALVFGAAFPGAAVGAAAAATAMGLLATLGLGLVAGALVLVLRRGDPFGWAVETLSVLLGGVFYPVEALPDVLQRAAVALPATHAIAAVRASFLQGADLAQIADRLLALAIIAVVTLPLGAIAVRMALRRLERDGSLGHS